MAAEGYGDPPQLPTANYSRQFNTESSVVSLGSSVSNDDARGIPQRAVVVHRQLITDYPRLGVESTTAVVSSRTQLDIPVRRPRHFST
jgi:hypothetical protein